MLKKERFFFYLGDDFWYGLGEDEGKQESR